MSAALAPWTSRRCRGSCLHTLPVRFWWNPHLPQIHYHYNTVKGKAGPLCNARVKSQRSVLSFHIKPWSRGQSLTPLHSFSSLLLSLMLPALLSSPNTHTQVHTPSSPLLDVQMPLLSALPQSPVIENNSQGPAPDCSSQPGGSLPMWQPPINTNDYYPGSESAADDI